MEVRDRQEALGLFFQPLAAFGGQATWTMPVSAGPWRPVSMGTVWASEKISAQCRCTTGGKAPKHPHFVLAQLKYRQESAQDGGQRQAIVGGIRAALHQGTERVHLGPLGRQISQQ